MSDSRFNSWRDFILDEEGYDHLNRNGDAVIDISKISGDNLAEKILEVLMKNPQVSVLAVNQIEGDVTFFHNV